MAVYTKMDDDALAWLASALGEGITPAEHREIAAGTNDSIHDVTFERENGESFRTIIKIAETPDVHGNGMDAEKAAVYAEFLGYGQAQFNAKTAEEQSESKLALPKIYPLFPNGAADPSLSVTMAFDKDGDYIAKSVTVIEFAEGQNFNHEQGFAATEKGNRINPHKVEIMGAAHGEWKNIYEGAPQAAQLNNPWPYGNFEAALDEMLKPESLTTVLRSKNVPDPEALIASMKDMARYLDTNWEAKTENLPIEINNADVFADNGKYLRDEKQYAVVDIGTAHLGPNVDLMMGINANAMKPDGTLDKRQANAYLKGRDSTRPITPEDKQASNFMGATTAFMWGFSRLNKLSKVAEKVDNEELSPEEVLNRIAGLRSPEFNMRRADFWKRNDELGTSPINWELAQAKTSSATEREDQRDQNMNNDKQL